MPLTEYVEIRNGGYYIAGSRMGLDILFHEYGRGRSPEDFFAAYPAVGSLARVYGAIAFILEHPSEIAAYLADQARILEEIKAQYPMSPDLAERFESARTRGVPRVA